MGEEAERQFRRALDEKSLALQDDAVVLAQWLRFCAERKHAYLSALLGHNRMLRKLNAHGFLERFIHGKKTLLSARNIVCCETHREAIETLFHQERV